MAAMAAATPTKTLTAVRDATANPRMATVARTACACDAVSVPFSVFTASESVLNLVVAVASTVEAARHVEAIANPRLTRRPRTSRGSETTASAAKAAIRAVSPWARKLTKA